MRAPCLLALLALLGCGDDDAPDESDGGAASGEPTIPLTWTSGARFGYGIVNQQTKLPTDLRATECNLTAAVAMASADGGLGVETEEGECVVTSTTTLRQLEDPSEAGLMPACAGAIAFQLGATTRRLTVCDAARFGAPLDLDCADVESLGQVSMTSGPDELEGDALSGLSLTVPSAPVPRIDTPASQGDGNGVWPSGPLELAWSGGPADAVEIVIGAVDGEGSVVRCVTADDGSFTVPDAILAPYRSQLSYVELAKVTQRAMTADGFAMKLAYRTSTVIHLNVSRP